MDKPAVVIGYKQLSTELCIYPHNISKAEDAEVYAGTLVAITTKPALDKVTQG